MGGLHFISAPDHQKVRAGPVHPPSSNPAAATIARRKKHSVRAHLQRRSPSSATPTRRFARAMNRNPGQITYRNLLLYCCNHPRSKHLPRDSLSTLWTVTSHRTLSPSSRRRRCPGATLIFRAAQRVGLGLLDIDPDAARPDAVLAPARRGAAHRVPLWMIYVPW